ncbi:MAG: hypothetical protein ICV63_08525 [Coleofasciculus sp. Co-bin14]|nr:hypothetical protein [Coleofasciculus sp. Co-bin14]
MLELRDNGFRFVQARRSHFVQSTPAYLLLLPMMVQTVKLLLAVLTLWCLLESTLTLGSTVPHKLPARAYQGYNASSQEQNRYANSRD